MINPLYWLSYRLMMDRCWWCPATSSVTILADPPNSSVTVSCVNNITVINSFSEMDCYGFHLSKFIIKHYSLRRSTWSPYGWILVLRIFYFIRIWYMCRMLTTISIPHTRIFVWRLHEESSRGGFPKFRQRIDTFYWRCFASLIYIYTKIVSK